MSKDLLFATSQRIDDKLWRNVFYANIEQVRSKLRKVRADNEGKFVRNILNLPVIFQLRPENDHAARHRLLKTFFRHIDATFKFYRDLNDRIKGDYHIDIRTLGIGT